MPNLFHTGCFSPRAAVSRNGRTGSVWPSTNASLSGWILWLEIPGERVNVDLRLKANSNQAKKNL